MKLKFILITCVLLYLPSLIYAQNGTENLRLSLQEARDLAVKKNLQLQAGSLNVKIEDEKIAQARLKRIPQVYGDFNLQRNLIIPITPVPAKAFNPNAAEGELLPLRFSTKWTANAGINAQVDLFNPQKKQELKEVSLQAEISKTQQQIEENNIDYEVSSAYAAALIADEQLRLAIIDTLTKANILKMSQQQYVEGRTLLAELNEVKTERNLSLSNYDEAVKIFSTAKAQLLYLLGYDPEQAVKIEFTDNIETLFDRYRQQKQMDTLGSLSLRKLKQDEQLLNAQLSTVKSGYLPILTLNGYFGSNYFDNNFDLFKSSNWNGNSFINVGLRIPITEGLDRSKKVNQLKLQQQANILSYQNQQHKNKLDLMAAQSDAVFYEKKYQRAVENYKMAEENYRNAQLQYDNGRLLIGDLFKQNYIYQQQKTNYLEVSYQFILARMKQETTLKN
jgi:outer membrane protein